MSNNAREVGRRLTWARPWHHKCQRRGEIEGGTHCSDPDLD